MSIPLWCPAQEDESWDAGSPGEYEKQAENLRSLLKTPLVFVLAALPSNARNRMVQKGIPFIVPGTQAFLPGALVDLRKRFPKPSQKGRTSLSPAAQLTLLYHLEREPLSNLPLTRTNHRGVVQIAQRFGRQSRRLTEAYPL